jgi:hypothetical protein
MEYYIKCESCGCENEIKSQPVIFCNKCKNKLRNNFISWKNCHSSDSFDEYLKSDWVQKVDRNAVVTINDEQIKEFDTKRTTLVVILLTTLINLALVFLFLNNIPTGYEMGAILIAMMLIKNGVNITLGGITGMICSYWLTKHFKMVILFGVISVILLILCEYLVAFKPNLIGL